MTRAIRSVIVTAMLVIGLMSGTSADGIDAALVEISGAPPGDHAGGDHEGSPLRWGLLKHLHVPYAPALQDEILTAANRATATIDRITALNVTLAEKFADAALQTAASAGISIHAIDLIGSHGQTLW
ncbi:MAG: anhydro-N-acetylmuramic acid kinase, partial [Chloroflexi bacterium]|nr:anhydro-N-acetylmuramic acid kinase [Chloroflexota bacterium]